MFYEAPTELGGLGVGLEVLEMDKQVKMVKVLELVAQGLLNEI
jgi:hypothetical protein